jgi:hypothetical protein
LVKKREKDKLYVEHQEGARKDVERAFRVLQAYVPQQLRGI